MNAVVSYLIVWGAIGCLLFGLFVILAFRTGLVYTARKADGTLKDEVPLSGKLAMTILPVGYILFQMAANYFGLVPKNLALSYGSLFLLNYGIYLILFLFDTFFIDGFVLAIWRPALLQLPDEMGRESMKTHMLISIPIGLLIGALLTLMSTTISFILWIQ